MDEQINFTYDDTDSYQNEISELYSYSEEPDFFANRNAFEESMEDCGLPLAWNQMVPEQKSRAVNYLMTTLEVSCRQTRNKSTRALTYLIQGNFGECQTLEDQATNSKRNVFLLYRQGLFHSLVQLLFIEANPNEESNHVDTYAPSQMFNESSELRLILAALYTIAETIYQAKSSSDPETLRLRSQFVSELQNSFGEESLCVVLFQMLNNFCSNQAPHYPVRKITLLLWKVLLITLGGTEDLKELKAKQRAACKLAPLPDDTMEVLKNMTPCYPPLLHEGDIIARARNAASGLMMKRKVFKQPAFDDAVFTYAKDTMMNPLPDYSDNSIERNPEDGLPDDNQLEMYELIVDPSSEENKNDGSSSDSGVSLDCEKPELEAPADAPAVEYPSNDDLCPVRLEDTPESSYASLPPDENDSSIDSIQISTSSNLKPGPASLVASSRSDVSSIYKGLPWKPKVRKADLNQHLANLRQKFLGYSLPNDTDTTLGLPPPIIEGINVLRENLYVSLAEVQLEREDLIENFPLTHGELNQNYRDEAAEKLYVALLPRLPQYMIALLKILLAASTCPKNSTDRTDSANIMAEINPYVSSQSIIQTVKMSIDANRHKEVIIKAISAILLLLLKHFKVNHIYQFEYVSQQLMFANCIPLILKFLSQDIYAYIVNSKSTLSAIDFPACVIGEQPELTTETIELCSFQPYSWRNMFACINLVRVLNKLTKWKHSRIMMLVVFKSSLTLLKALSVRQAMFQLYVLKLLKVQLKFLGRPWKKSNMKLISPIYQKVRHRLTDDWAYSNDNEAKPWDFQAEEFTLQANINKFHQRRYRDIVNQKAATNPVYQNGKFKALDDLVDSDYDFGLFDASHISPNFERNYERWLDSEVFQRRIDWDKLLDE